MARPTQILKIDGEGVVLSSTPLTRTTGVLGLLYDNRRRLAVLQPNRSPLESDGQRHTHAAGACPTRAPSGLGRAVGNVFETPNEVGQAVHQIALAPDLGPAPVWVFRPEFGVWVFRPEFGHTWPGAKRTNQAARGRLRSDHPAEPVRSIHQIAR